MNKPIERRVNLNSYQHTVKWCMSYNCLYVIDTKNKIICMEYFTSTHDLSARPFCSITNYVIDVCDSQDVSYVYSLYLLSFL